MKIVTNVEYREHDEYCTYYAHVQLCTDSGKAVHIVRHCEPCDNDKHVQ